GGDPLLAPLDNNGGPTPTMALLAGSPAIHAGDVAFVTGPPFPGPPFTDQRGMPPITGGKVDIGAYQSQAPRIGSPKNRTLLSTWTVTDSSDDPADTGSLRYAILNAPSGMKINVASTVTGLITLTHGALKITKNLRSK